ncbi:Cdc6/Cdc18 family protein [Haloarchaeobius salinus]|uniref:Cdc6/Cdc18 family protein n=1 Tax=Haloarchaeobius salinus TaxID=1198298 RepID=UPI00210DF99D|nr:AAA family ATPase [Haloarchaeobius salinus]
MDIEARIRRRQRRSGEPRIVQDYDALSPVVHVEEPSGRGPVLEQLLDHLDPIFERSLPPTAYVWGDGGVGKSAVVTALFEHLDRMLTGTGSVIHTTTRARSTPAPDFVYVDARVDDSEFGLYHTVLDGLVDEQVPKQGVRTDSLRSRLMERLSGTDRAVVAVDHVDELDTLGLATLHDAFDGMDDRLSWIAVGRTPPEELSSELLPPEHIHVPPYQQHALVDLLTGRASDGLARQSFDHEQIRRVAEWAEGDAHDALTALFGAAEVATGEGHGRIHERDLGAGLDAVPRPTVALGRVLTLPENRQLVLRTLVDLPDEATTSVGEAAESVAAAPGVDLSPSTVKRYLYELAEEGITERVTTERRAESAGRPPSRLEPRFPTLVFSRLYDLQRE